MAGVAVEYFLRLQGATAVGLLLGMLAAKLVQSANGCAVPKPRRPSPKA